MSERELLDPVFFFEGKDIYLRCVNDEGQHIGDLRIARAEMAGHAHTLVNAANAGMKVFTERNVERGLRKLLEDGK